MAPMSIVIKKLAGMICVGESFLFLNLNIEKLSIKLPNKQIYKHYDAEIKHHDKVKTFR